MSVACRVALGAVLLALAIAPGAALAQPGAHHSLRQAVTD